MATTITAINEKLWKIFQYEIEMHFGTREVIRIISGSSSRLISGIDNSMINNCIVESALLHTRILVEIFLETGNRKQNPDVISISDLLSNWKQSKDLITMIEELRRLYGRASDKNSPHWVLNKYLAHPSSYRTTQYNYSQVRKVIDHIMLDIIKEISTLANEKEIGKLLPSKSSVTENYDTTTHTVHPVFVRRLFKK